ncbi:hypothetical protein [Derxia gummosa]|uniref:Uncharacterized protein n=1 Tax=Derxia gummosa DSM 723 TaxID=1121388 RepID=A0A8B6X0V7_9BURK|nr:hypothetical protein [Derxia gummosa]
MPEIIPGSYLRITPWGAWCAIENRGDEPARRALLAILREPESPLLTITAACLWTGEDDEHAALLHLYALQQAGCIEALDRPARVPAEALEQLLPPLLEQIGSEKRAVLADALGFRVASSTWPEADADAIAAMSAEMLTVAERHERALAALGKPGASGWGMVDPVGVGAFGLWPLHVGPVRLALALTGRPRLNQPAFADMIWALCVRYAGEMSVMK